MAPAAFSSETVPISEKIIELLHVAGGGPLSQGLIAYVLDMDRASVLPEINELIEEGIIAEKTEQRSPGWMLLDPEPPPDTDTLPPQWSERLVEYALSSPGATVSELVAAADQVRTEPGLRAGLLHQAVTSAREIGEFRTVSTLVEDMIALSGDGLTEVQVRDIIAIVEPRQLKELDPAVVKEFICGVMDGFNLHSDRIMALTRLGEIEIMGNRLPKGILLLNEALSISIEHEIGEWIPAILENLAEMTSDYDRISRTAEQIHEVIAWTPVLSDDDLKLRILATAAASLARIKRHKAANTTIQAAIALSSQISPDTRRILEWCRARVHIASGRVSESVVFLERALLLAENLNDQAAVSDILDTLVLTMKGQPGYTIRSLTAIMERVSRRATTSGNISNQLYALNHLSDMYMRILQFSGVQRVHLEIDRLLTTTGLLLPDPVPDWCDGFRNYLTGGQFSGSEANLLISGSVEFLSRIREGVNPGAEADTIAEYFNSRDSTSTFIYGLCLALEAFACGFSSAAAVIAAALQRSVGKAEGENSPCLRLCVSGLLAEEDNDAEDFLSSAQVLARQMDRLLLVWMLLRCRLILDVKRGARQTAGISLLLMELDQYIMLQLPVEERERFSDIPRVKALEAELERMSGRSGPVSIIRDALTNRLEVDPTKVLDEVGAVSSRFTSRSEISWSLEAMGTITRSSRIQALRVNNSDIRIIESYGLGRERLPGRESTEVILQRPEAIRTIDNFGISPFGSRRFMVIPTATGLTRETGERRHPSGPQDCGNYLLLEMESPIDTTANTEFLISCFVRQIGSSLLLRERETQSYYDTMTGAAIRSSWMKRLNMELAEGATPSAPLSVLLVDIDRFKMVNDTFGHREGDRILKAVVTSISNALRPNDVIGRIGGDEFGIILPAASTENAAMIAERVCLKVSSTVFRQDQIPVTVSIGVATVDSTASQSDMVISRADAALYQSKQSGRNRQTVWSSASDPIFDGHKRLSILDTGDPGWDHILGQTVMELLHTPREEITITDLVERLRDVLRCEYLYLESSEGEKIGSGPEFAARAMEKVHHAYPGRISEHEKVLGKFHILSRMLPRGGQQVAVWDETEILPQSIKGVFRALGNLADLLLGGR